MALRSGPSRWSFVAAPLVVLSLLASCAPGEPTEGGLAPSTDDLVGIHLVPDSVTLQPGEFVDLSAVAELRSGGTGVVSVVWQSTGGSMSGTGRYTAGSSAGVFHVIGRHAAGFEDTSTIVVSVPQAPPAVLTRINVTPTSVAITPGATQPFAVAGVMSDGSGSAVAVNWTTTGGTISTGGSYVAPSAAGSYLVVATQQGGALADTAQVTVTTPPATLAAIVMTPPAASLQFTQTQQFAAIGHLSDGGTTAVPLTWTATGGTVSATGLYTAGGTAGTFRVIARAANGMADTSAITLSAPSIVSLVLTPSTVSLISGQTRQFAVSASLSNGGTQANPPVTWSATGGAVNGSGLYTAGATAGVFQVVATSANGNADSSAVTVALPTVTSVAILPAVVSLTVGQTQQFTASALLSNGVTQSNPTLTWTATGGTVSTGGLYTAGNSAGTFRVIGSSVDGKADTSSVTITAATVTAIALTPPTVSLQVGATQQFSVSATLSNGATQPNPAVTWTATGGTVSSGGLYTAGSTAGTFRVITAAASGAADTSAITVTGATITAVSLTPASVSLQSGATQQYSVSATLSTGGTQSNPPVSYTVTGGTISAGGLYTAGGAAGSFRVIATAAGGAADTSAVTITAATITAISASPDPASLTTGQAQQFAASATMSNGSTQQNPSVSWTATGGSISAGGMFTAGSAAGSFRVIATSTVVTRADTVAVTLTAPAPGGEYPNRPSSYGQVLSDFDFSKPVPPGGPFDADRPVPGTEWYLIFDNPGPGQTGSSYTRVNDATAHNGSSSVWEVMFPRGSYGGGVEGLGNGHGSGNFFRYFDSSVKKIYLSYWIKWSAGFQWQTVSTKHLRFFDGYGYVQAYNSGKWLWVEFPNYDIFPEPIVNTPISTGVWHQIELIIESGSSGQVRLWMDGQLRTDYHGNVPTGSNSGLQTLSFDAFLGGGGQTVNNDMNYRLDHVFIAAP